MAFDSLEFAAFFVVVLTLSAVPLPWTVKKAGLLLASYYFYAAWSPRYVLLLMLAAIVDFGLSHLLYRVEGAWLRRWIVVASLSLNFGLLAFFKYSIFLVTNINFALFELGLVGTPRWISPPDVTLPLGISFYTFETVSYLIDVYRRRIEPTRSFLDYALFLTFFPHLVAGPIVRANDFLPQLATPRHPRRADLGWGVYLMLLGLFEKTVLADFALAPLVDRVYFGYQPLAWSDAWLGTLAFAGQIFCDFAGYSTIGIGAALCFGFRLKRNFRFPYAAIGLSDFWRRWHISLSSWLRDYLYIPLGATVTGPARPIRISCSPCCWEGYGTEPTGPFDLGRIAWFFLVAERIVLALAADAAWTRWRLVRAGAWLATFAAVNMAWVFFRADSIVASRSAF